MHAQQDLEKCDNRESIEHSLKHNLKRVESWNMGMIRRISSSWQTISQEVVRLVHEMSKLEVKMLKNEGVLHRSDEVTLTTDFASIFHQVLICSARALERNYDSLLGDSKNMTESVLRSDKSLESAVSRMIRESVHHALSEPAPQTHTKQVRQYDYTMESAESASEQEEDHEEQEEEHDDAEQDDNEYIVNKKEDSDAEPEVKRVSVAQSVAAPPEDGIRQSIMARMQSM